MRNNRRLSVALLAALATLLVPAATARAQNLLVNGSFEDGDFTGVNPQSAAGATQLNVGATNMTGWTTVNQELAWIGAGNPYTIVASDGVRALDLSGYHDFAPFGGVTQTLATQPGAVYNLAFDLGSVIAGNSPVSLRAAAGGAFQDFSFNRTGGAGGQQWGRFGFNFTATSSSTAITLTGLSAANSADLLLDNASVTLVSAAVPEPGAAALLGAGSLLPAALMVARRRRRS